MSIQFNTKHKLVIEEEVSENGVLKPQMIEHLYTFVDYHRIKTRPKKSIWNISADDEITIFTESRQKKFHDGKFAWGYMKDANNKFITLGLSDKNKELKIAKFVDTATLDWHGYPADHNKEEDRPTNKIFKIWLDHGIINKRKWRKIKQDKSCKL